MTIHKPMTDPGTGETDEARRELRAAAPEAVETVRELLDADDEQVRLDAAALVLTQVHIRSPLDHADGRGGVDGEPEAAADALSLSMLAKRLGALEKAFQQTRQNGRR